MRILLFAVLMPFIAVLAGCGKFYWVKPGVTVAEFNRDDKECALGSVGYVEESGWGFGAGGTSASGRGGSFKGNKISEVGYRLCMRDRGYMREKYASRPSDGFRGITDDLRK